MMRLSELAMVDVVIITRSPQLQCCQAKQHQHHSNDPETNDDTWLRPAFEFEVMMYRRHTKDALSGELEGANLNNDRDRFQHEYCG